MDIGKVTISCTNQTGDAKEEIYVSTEGKIWKQDLIKIFLRCT